MIEIVDYLPHHSESFKALNEAWIKKYFVLEESDEKMLNDPEEYILKNGGAIVIAELDGEPVGACALISKADGTFELAKMAVDPNAQGQKIGWKIGLAVIEKARELGANSVYLETNSILKPAIQLYKKLGFKEVEGYCSPYARCNVQMELKF